MTNEKSENNTNFPNDDKGIDSKTENEQTILGVDKIDELLAKICKNENGFIIQNHCGDGDNVGGNKIIIGGKK